MSGNQEISTTLLNQISVPVDVCVVISSSLSAAFQRINTSQFENGLTNWIDRLSNPLSHPRPSDNDARNIMQNRHGYSLPGVRKAIDIAENTLNDCFDFAKATRLNEKNALALWQYGFYKRQNSESERDMILVRDIAKNEYFNGRLQCLLTISKMIELYCAIATGATSSINSQNWTDASSMNQEIERIQRRQANNESHDANMLNTMMLDSETEILLKQILHTNVKYMFEHNLIGNVVSAVEHWLKIRRRRFRQQQQQSPNGNNNNNETRERKNIFWKQYCVELSAIVQLLFTISKRIQLTIEELEIYFHLLKWILKHTDFSYQESLQLQKCFYILSLAIYQALDTSQTKINVRGNGELIENSLKTNDDTEKLLNLQMNQFGLSGYIGNDSGNSGNINDDDIENEDMITRMAKQFLLLFIVLYKRKLEVSQQRNINSKKWDNHCQIALQNGALFGLRHDLLYNEELIPESLEFTDSIYQSMCHLLLQLLQYFDEQMKIYFQNEIDKIGQRRLQRPNYGGTFSSDLKTIEKQNLRQTHGLSICLDMFVRLCQHSRIVSNDFIDDDIGKSFLQYTDESATLTTPWFGYYCDLLYSIANHGSDQQDKIYQWLLNRVNYSNETADNATRNMKLEFIYDVLKRCQEIYSLIHYNNNNNNDINMNFDHSLNASMQQQQQARTPPQLHTTEMPIFVGILKVLKCVGSLEGVQRALIPTVSQRGTFLNQSMQQQTGFMPQQQMMNDMSHLSGLSELNNISMNQSTIFSQNVGTAAGGGMGGTSIYTGVTRPTGIGGINGATNIAIIDGASQLSILDILFRLLHSNLQAELKGLMMECITKLISGNSMLAKKVWYQLEKQQVLHTSRTSNEAIQGIELDIMEGEKLGANATYPVTVPFVELILKLLDTTDIPDKLGINIRKTRLPGIQPYMEYVRELVFKRWNKREYKYDNEKWALSSHCLKIFYTLLQRLKSAGLNITVMMNAMQQNTMSLDNDNNNNNNNNSNMGDQPRALNVNMKLLFAQYPAWEFMTLLLVPHSPLVEVITNIFYECTTTLHDESQLIYIRKNEQLMFNLESTLHYSVKLLRFGMSLENRFLNICQKCFANRLSLRPLTTTLLSSQYRERIVALAGCVDYSNNEIVCINALKMLTQMNQIQNGITLRNIFETEDHLQLVCRTFAEKLLKGNSTFLLRHSNNNNNDGGHNNNNNNESDINNERDEAMVDIRALIIEFLLESLELSKHNIGYLLLGFSDKGANYDDFESQYSCLNRIFDMVQDGLFCQINPGLAESIFELFYKLEQNPNIGQRFLIAAESRLPKFFATLLRNCCENTPTNGIEGTNEHKFLPSFLKQRSLLIQCITLQLHIAEKLRYSHNYNNVNSNENDIGMGNSGRGIGGTMGFSMNNNLYQYGMTSIGLENIEKIENGVDFEVLNFLGFLVGDNIGNASDNVNNVTTIGNTSGNNNNENENDDKTTNNELAILLEDFDILLLNKPLNIQLFWGVQLEEYKSYIDSSTVSSNEYYWDVSSLRSKLVVAQAMKTHLQSYENENAKRDLLNSMVDHNLNVQCKLALVEAYHAWSQLFEYGLKIIDRNVSNDINRNGIINERANDNGFFYLLNEMLMRLSKEVGTVHNVREIGIILSRLCLAIWRRLRVSLSGEHVMSVTTTSCVANLEGLLKAIETNADNRLARANLWCCLLNYINYCDIKVSSETTDSTLNNNNNNNNNNENDRMDMKTRDDLGIDIADWDDELSKEKAILAKNNVKTFFTHHYQLFSILFKDAISNDPFSVSASTLVLQKLLTCYQDISIENISNNNGNRGTIGSMMYGMESSPTAWLELLLDKSRIDSVIAKIGQLDELMQRALLSAMPSKNYVIYQFTSMMSLLISCATHPRGSHRLIDSNVIEKLSQMKCLSVGVFWRTFSAQANNNNISNNVMANRVSGVLSIQTTYFLTLFNLCLRLMNSLFIHDNKHRRLHYQTLQFFKNHSDIVDHMLVTDSEDIAALRCIKLLLCIWSQLYLGPLYNNDFRRFTSTQDSSTMAEIDSKSKFFDSILKKQIDRITRMSQEYASYLNDNGNSGGFDDGNDENDNFNYNNNNERQRMFDELTFSQVSGESSRDIKDEILRMILSIYRIKTIGTTKNIRRLKSETSSSIARSSILPIDAATGYNEFELSIHFSLDGIIIDSSANNDNNILNNNISINNKSSNNRNDMNSRMNEFGIKVSLSDLCLCIESVILSLRQVTTWTKDIDIQLSDVSHALQNGNNIHNFESQLEGLERLISIYNFTLEHLLLLLFYHCDYYLTCTGHVTGITGMNSSNNQIDSDMKFDENSGNKNNENMFAISRMIAPLLNFQAKEEFYEKYCQIVVSNTINRLQEWLNDENQCIFNIKQDNILRFWSVTVGVASNTTRIFLETLIQKFEQLETVGKNFLRGFR